MPLMPIAQVVSSGSAGAMVQLYDSTAGGNVANFDITAIPQTYNHLRLVLMGRSDRALANCNVQIRFNNDSGANYETEYALISNTNSPTGNKSTGQTGAYCGDITAASATTGDPGMAIADIPCYTQTTFNKIVNFFTGYINVGGNYNSFFGTTMWANTAAITRVTVIEQSGANYIAGTRATLYGIL